jgi:hypothetical protein
VSLFTVRHTISAALCHVCFVPSDLVRCLKQKHFWLPLRSCPFLTLGGTSTAFTKILLLLISVPLSKCDSSSGTLNGSSGTLNSSSGTLNGSSGTLNSSSGTLNSSSGTLNGSSGTLNSSSGTLNSSSGTLNSTSGTLNKVTSAQFYILPNWQLTSNPTVPRYII